MPELGEDGQDGGFSEVIFRGVMYLQHQAAPELEHWL